MRCVNVSDLTRLDTPSVVCLGFFDGVHRGHAALVTKGREIADREGLTLVVHTFDRMPARALHPEAGIEELTPLPEKCALLAALGVDLVAVSAFDERTMRMPGAEFFRRVLAGTLHARHIVAGFHHVFGYMGDTDARALSALCGAAGVGLSVIDPVRLAGGELVSSTAIRRALAVGDTAAAEAMLGRKTERAGGVAK